MTLKTISKVNVRGKRVLLRAGFDVPIKDGVIQDDWRIKAGLPTIEYLLQNGAAHITVINHIGRPNGNDPAFTNQPVIKRVLELVSDPSRVEVKENLRFDSRETANDPVFARELVSNQDIFVQDAFNTLHNKHTSIVQIPLLLPSYAGLLVEKEVDTLSHLMSSPDQPFVVIIGGKKFESKLPVIENIKRLASKILVGGQVANEIIKSGKYQSDPKVVLPQDGVNDEQGEMRDIGPQTIERFKQELSGAKTVFWNGNLGMTEKPEFANGSKAIADYLITIGAKIYIGGGDTASYINSLGIAFKIEFISTGGGASLKFLARDTLPGLVPLIENS